MRRYLFIDPSLKHSGGHNLILAQMHATGIGPENVWYAINRHADLDLNLPTERTFRSFQFTLTEAARQRRYGWIPRPASRMAERLARASFQIRKPASPEAVVSKSPRAKADATRARSLHTLDLFAACAAFSPGCNDVLVFDSGDAEQGVAVAELLESGKTGGALIYFRLMYDDANRYPTDFAWSGALRRMVQASSGSSRLCLATETYAFSRALEEVVERPVSVFPHPSKLLPVSPPSGQVPFVLFVPGEPRVDKGTRAAEAIADKMPEHLRQRVQIRIQTISKGRSFEQLPERLSPVEYAEAWRTCHAALLLHDPVGYKLRGSGVVCDAVASERPFICLRGSSLAEWARFGNASVSDPEPTSIVDALTGLVDGYDRYLEATTSVRNRLNDLTRCPWSVGVED